MWWCGLEVHLNLFFGGLFSTDDWQEGIRKDRMKEKRGFTVKVKNEVLPASAMTLKSKEEKNIGL